MHYDDAIAGLAQAIFDCADARYNGSSGPDISMDDAEAFAAVSLAYLHIKTDG